MEKVFEIYITTNPERWMMVLSGLKTLLETGELLTTPGSLRIVPAVARDSQSPKPSAAS